MVLPLTSAPYVAPEYTAVVGAETLPERVAKVVLAVFAFGGPLKDVVPNVVAATVVEENWTNRGNESPVDEKLAKVTTQHVVAWVPPGMVREARPNKEND